jgi:Na+-translocating ferredoxin:NAD+ oxidoreductase subunit B
MDVRRFMEKETASKDNVYVELLKKIGYTNPQSKYLLSILRKMASVEDARLMLALPAEPAALTQKTGMAEEEIKQRVKVLAEKGLVITSKKGPRMFSSITQLHDANLASSAKWVDTELLDLWKDFYELEQFPTIADTPWDQYVQYIRTVPAWKAIKKSPDLPLAQLPPEENLLELVRGADLIAVVPCTCRRSMRRCHADLENCVTFNRGAEYAIERGAGRRITVDEAMVIFEKSEEQGLVHTWPFAASPRLNEVCNCCRDCCGIFDGGIKFGNLQHILQKTHLKARVDTDLCNGCQDCVERCYFSAIDMAKAPQGKKLKAAIDEKKCWGCGVCVVGCPVDAITMKLAPQPTTPKA